MAKVKIYELAKELSVESKELIRKLGKMGVEAKSHMSTINEKEAEALRQEFAQKGSGGSGGFVPRVKRIPKSVVEKEQADVAPGEATGTEAAAQPAPQPEAPQKTEQQQPVAAQAPEAKAEAAPKAAPAAPVKAAEPVAAAAKPASSAQPAPSAPAAGQAPAKPQTPAPAANQQQQSRPQGQGQRPQGQGQRPQGQGGYQGGQNRPQGQRPQGQGGYQGGQNRPQGQGQGRPQGQGGYQGGQNRPQGQGQRPQGQGGYQGGQNRPQGQGQRPQGQGGYQGGQGRPQGQGQGRPQGQGGYQGGQGRPQGGGYQGGQGRPQGGGQGRPQGGGQGRPQGNRGGLNIPPPQGNTEKPASNYRPQNKKGAFVKDQKFERVSSAEGGRKDYRGGKNNRKGGKNNKGRGNQQKTIMPPVTIKKIMIGEIVVLGELAKSMGKTAGEVIKKLFEMGIMATINQELDSDTAILLAEEFGITVEVIADKTAEILEDVDDDEDNLMERPPVVTIMGHVDHGKTSLLDAIRNTNVISTEAGGITQHIGAYQVEIKGKKITFLDTPGHEAFTAMRARGAQMTDIVIIVVAADDGVMPQTIEAINHSKAAKVPIIIAINKIDKPGANPDRVKQELMEHGLVSEEWGGDIIMVPVSAKANQNIEGLLETILLVSEVQELKANPDRQARGFVVESRLDKNRGPVVTLLVQKGTLHVGDNLLAGPVFGKVRAMLDDKGRKVKTAPPAMPVEVLGFSEVPDAGEVFISAKDDKDARFVAHRQSVRKREEELRKTARVSLDDLFSKIAEGEIKDLNLVVKADVHGSVEALQQSLLKLNEETNEVKVNVIHSAVGGISESDVMLATASDAIIIGFNVRPMPAAVKAAEAEGVDIRLYRVIYDALEDIKKAMSGLLAPEFKEVVIGHAEVRQLIKVPKAGMIAGSYVQEGKIARNAQVRVVRDSVVVAEDTIASLRRFKDDVKEVMTGYECGIGLENFNDIKEGDVIEAFIMEEIKREL